MLRTRLVTRFQVGGTTGFRRSANRLACAGFLKPWNPRCRDFHRKSLGMKQNPSVSPNTNVRRNASLNLNENQKLAQLLIKNIRHQRIQPRLVALTVEEMLLKLVTDESYVGRKHNDGPIASDLLHAALNCCEKKSTNLIPRICSLSMQVIRRSGHPLGPNEMHRIMWTILERRDELFTDDVILNTKHINDAFCQVVRSHVEMKHLTYETNKTKNDHDVCKRIDRLVELIRHLWEDPSVRLVANSEAIHAIILHWCRTQKTAQAYKLLMWISNESQTSSHPVALSPQASSFTSVISAYGRLGDAETAEKLVRFMLASYKKGKHTIPPPSLVCMNALIDGWARSGRNDAGMKAAHTMELMENLHHGEGLETKPDEITYASCINAWAHSKPSRNSAVQAELLLRRMIEHYEAGEDIGPTESAFTATMNAWAESATNDAPVKVQSLLKLMQGFSQTRQLARTDIPYTILIKAWKNLAQRLPSGNDKKRWCSDHILSVLEDMVTSGVNPTAATHNSTIMALLEVAPSDAMLYFLHVEEKFRNGQADVDTRTFNSGLNVIAVQNKPDGADHAMMVMERMLSYSRQNKSVAPTGYTYNIILKILSRSPAKDSASKACALLRDMLQMEHIKPSYISFATCVLAWGRSGDPSRFDQIHELLLQFITTYREGNLSGLITVTPYNTALSACYHNTSPELRGTALRTALRTMDELRKLKNDRVRPDHITYQSFFRAMQSLRTEGDDIDDLIQSEFEACIKAGLVTPEIIEMLYRASFHTFCLFFGSTEKPETVTLPKEWSRVRHRQKQPSGASGFET